MMKEILRGKSPCIFESLVFSNFNQLKNHVFMNNMFTWIHFRCTKNWISIKIGKLHWAIENSFQLCRKQNLNQSQSHWISPIRYHENRMKYGGSEWMPKVCRVQSDTGHELQLNIDKRRIENKPRGNSLRVCFPNEWKRWMGDEREMREAVKWLTTWVSMYLLRLCSSPNNNRNILLSIYVSLVHRTLCIRLS